MQLRRGEVKRVCAPSPSFGASDVNVSFVVAEQDAEHAVRALHREFFESAADAPAIAADARGRIVH